MDYLPGHVNYLSLEYVVTAGEAYDRRCAGTSITTDRHMGRNIIMKSCNNTNANYVMYAELCAL